MEYVYVTNNNLEARQYYNYSKYNGKDFLLAFKESRDEYMTHPSATQDEIESWIQDMKEHHYADHKLQDIVILKKELCDVLLDLYMDNTRFCTEELFAKILKTFEVRKRLYHCYNEKFKPFDESDYNDLILYILFGLAVSKAYEITKNLKYMNALIKVVDILLSIGKTHKQGEDLGQFITYIITCEQSLFNALKQSLLEE